MQIPIYQVDAFSDRPFGGNPAAVCPLERWIPDATMQSIAAEMNLAETAFFVETGDGYHIRWFTPTVEVSLCGHATLASAAVVFRHLQPGDARITFHSASGPLAVTQTNGVLELDFPAFAWRDASVGDDLVAALGGVRPIAAIETTSLFAIFDRAEAVRAVRPDLMRLAAVHAFAVGVTAPGTGADADVDFVSRFFAPAVGIPEDPATGSAHCTLTPYWAKRLGKDRLRARQVSARQGELTVTSRGDRVGIAGHATVVLEGTLTI